MFHCLFSIRMYECGNPVTYKQNSRFYWRILVVVFNKESCIDETIKNP